MHVPQAQKILIRGAQAVSEGHGSGRELLGAPFGLAPYVGCDAPHHAGEEITAVTRAEMGSGVQQQVLDVWGQDAEVRPVLGASGVQRSGKRAGRPGGAGPDQRRVRAARRNRSAVRYCACVFGDRGMNPDHHAAIIGFAPLDEPRRM